MDKAAAPAATNEQPHDPPGPRSTRYLLSEAKKGRLQALAQLAPTLKEGELRLLLYLEAATEHLDPHAIRISLRQVATDTTLALSAVQRNLDAMEHRGLISRSRGTATKPGAILVNTLSTVEIAVPFRGTPPPHQGGQQPTNGCDSKSYTGRLFEAQAVPVGGTPPAENAQLTATAGPVDIEGFCFTPKSVIDRLLHADPKKETPDALQRARNWMHGYAAKFSRRNPNPHPPDDKILAQLLAVADWPRLEALFYDLMAERKEPGDSYAWFVTVALQRIHGIAPGVLKQHREQLKIVRRTKQLAGEVADPQAAADLFDQVAAAGKVLK